jgi:hypothetical protein
MEAQRPDPVDMSKFSVGESRLNIVSEVGPPESTLKEGENSCDVYRLYTKGPSTIGKGAIAVTETLADVATLGLAEIVLTPTEAATKNSKHTVVFCYSPENKLVFVRQADTSVDH